MAFSAGSHSHSRRSSFGESHRSSFSVLDREYSEARHQEVRQSFQALSEASRKWMPGSSKPGSFQPADVMKADVPSDAPAMSRSNGPRAAPHGADVPAPAIVPEARPWMPQEAAHSQRPVLMTRELSEGLPRISSSMQSLTRSVRSFTTSVGHTLTSTVPSFNERAKLDGLGAESTFEGMTIARSNTEGTAATTQLESARPWCPPQVTGNGPSQVVQPPQQVCSDWGHETAKDARGRVENTRAAATVAPAPSLGRTEAPRLSLSPGEIDFFAVPGLAPPLLHLETARLLESQSAFFVQSKPTMLPQQRGFTQSLHSVRRGGA